MYKLQMNLKEKAQEALDQIGSIVTEETGKALEDLEQGKTLCAKTRRDIMSSGLTAVCQDHFNMAKHWEMPEAEELEKNLRKLLMSSIPLPSEKN